MPQWVEHFRAQGARTVPDIAFIVDNQGVQGMPPLERERLKDALIRWREGSFRSFYTLPDGNLSEGLPRFEDVNWTWWVNIALTFVIIALVVSRAWQMFATLLAAPSVVAAAVPVAVPAAAAAVDCVDEDAEVTMYNRSRQVISKVRVGDEILSFSDGSFLVKKVTGIKVGRSSEMTRVVYKLPSGKLSDIYVTAGHPLYVNEKGWSVMDPSKVRHRPEGGSVHQLMVGDKLVLGDDSAADVVSLTKCSANRKTYNLIVDGVGTFFCNGLLMHSGLPPNK